MRGIIYTRVSSDEQVDGTSLTLQDELCRKYCEQKAIEVVALFREEGESAKDLSLSNRKQFLAALEFCRKDKAIDAFVVLKVDRFARNTDDHFAVRRLLLNYGTALHSVTEPIGNRPAEKFVETVLAGAAEYDNAIRKQRCTDGMLARINQGIWPFRPPIGYACAHHRKRGEKKTRPDEPDLQVFPLIQRALKGFASGDILSQAEICRQLDVWGLSVLRGKPTRPQLVDQLLGKYLKFYAGFLVNPWTREEKAGLHKPMINEWELIAIRDRRAGKARGQKAKRDRFNPLFPLRQTIRCSTCRRGLTAALSSGNGGTYGYYYCVNKSCGERSKGIRSSLIHPEFVTFLKKIALTGRFLSVFDESVRELWGKRSQIREADRLRSGREVAELTARRKRICEMREDGTYDNRVFHERLAEIDAATQALRAPAPVTDFETFSVEAALSSARWLGTELVQIWNELPPHAMPRFEHLLFPDGIDYDRTRGFRTTQLGLIFALNRSAATRNSLKVHLRRISTNHLSNFLRDAIQFQEEFRRLTAERKSLLSAA